MSTGSPFRKRYTLQSTQCLETQASCKKPSIAKPLQRDASKFPKTESVGGTAFTSGGASDSHKLALNDDGSVSNSNRDPTSKTVLPKSDTASGGSGVRDAKQNRGHTSPMSSAELPYHYDASSIFRVKDSHLKETIPTVEVRRSKKTARVAGWTSSPRRGSLPCTSVAWN